MARKYGCEVCTNLIEEGYTGAVFDASISFAAFEGKPQPTLKVKVDVCSAKCLVKYVTERLLPDIAQRDAKWRTYGTSSVAPPNQHIGLRFNTEIVPAARRLKR